MKLILKNWCRSDESRHKLKNRSEIYSSLMKYSKSSKIAMSPWRKRIVMQKRWRESKPNKKFRSIPAVKTKMRMQRKEKRRTKR